MSVPNSNPMFSSDDRTASRADERNYAEWFAGKRVVVTGGAGFLGHVVVRKLREAGCREVAVPRRANCDLARRKNVENLLNAARPDLVIHLAARVDNSLSQIEAAACFYENVLMSAHLIDAVARRGIEKLVVIGSAASYPSSAALPLREADLFVGLPEASREAHGVAKRVPLIHAQACRRQYGLRFAFLIASNLYGPHDNFDPQMSYVIPSLVRTFVDAAESNCSEVTLRGSGNITRDFLHVEDCTDAILLASALYDGDDAVNLGSGVEVRISDLAAHIAQLAGYEGKIFWSASHAKGASRRVLDTQRAARAFGFRARRNLDDGLREVIDSYRGMRQDDLEPARAQAFASPA